MHGAAKCHSSSESVLNLTVHSLHSHWRMVRRLSRSRPFFCVAVLFEFFGGEWGELAGLLFILVRPSVVRRVGGEFTHSAWSIRVFGTLNFSLGAFGLFV